MLADSTSIFSGIAGIIMIAVGLVLTIMTILLPFFVYSIKQDMETLVKQMEQNNAWLQSVNNELWQIKNGNSPDGASLPSL